VNETVSTGLTVTALQYSGMTITNY